MKEKESPEGEMSYRRYYSHYRSKSETRQRDIVESQGEMSYHRFCSYCISKSETPQRAVVTPTS